jgi:hypothetical protein
MPDSALETFLKYAAPWLLYALASWVQHPALGCLAAVVLLAVMIVRKPARTKAVEVVLAGYFLLLLIGVSGLAWSWLMACQGWLASGLLSAMAYGSVLIGSPFTLAFARETTPSDMWQNPHFFLVNRILTLVWGLAFLISAAVKFENQLPRWASLGISSVLMFAALLFTKWYPAWYRREIYLKDPTTPASERTLA